MKKLRTSAGLAVVLVAAGGLTVQAARQPDHLINTAQFDVANGAPARAARSVTYQAPRSHAGWTRFQAMEGGTWHGMWDAQTGVPVRIYGSGIAAPGSLASPEIAEQVARAQLARHIELLAPGARTSDFSLVSNVVHDGMRSVGFFQHHKGMRVLGGQVSFRFKNDRLFMFGSEALPNVETRAGSALILAHVAEEAAHAWIQADFSAADTSTMRIEGPFVLPIVRDGDAGIEFATVLSVRVDSAQPVGRWDVYVDAHSGEVVARRQKLFFGAGTLRYNTPQRRPTSTRADFPAMFATVTLNGGSVTSDVAGGVTYAGTNAAAVTTRVGGPFAQVINQAGGGLATANFTLPNGGSITWNEGASEIRDAQVTAFVHTNLAKQFARDNMNADLGFLGEQMQVTVNINQTCNAFSDGDNSINFFRNGGGCENTARLPDVVYHEFGHSIHGRSIIPGVGDFDGAMSEGAGDFLSAIITEDPGVGRGFFLNNPAGALRDIDPVGSEHVFPDDFINEVHEDGLIYAGAMWDMRKELIQLHGQQAGAAIAAKLFNATLQRASDMFTAHAEVLAADDDDGNLANGTPNSCIIDRHFAVHGLADANAPTGLNIGTPVEDGFKISFEVRQPQGACEVPQITTARLIWQLREDPGTGDQIEMSVAGETYEATIPLQDEGQVINYRIEMQLEDGSTRVLPDNPADPMYEKFVGGVVELYCTDFETDPLAEGWTTGATRGLNDWQFGAPQRPAAGDPPVAFSGTRVFGNDLSVDGEYEANTTNFAVSPVVETQGFENVRLQYRRWLNVEDSFFDDATISVNGQLAFTNLNSNQGNNSDTHHRDREWRFQDVDLTPFVQNGQVQVRFEIASDQSLEFGGWTMDDFCVVAFVRSECGDGNVTGVETCDDGADNSDTAPDACRANCQVASCGDGVTDSAEECDDGNGVDDDACSNACIGEDVGGGDPPGGCGCAAGTDAAPGAMLLWLVAFFGIVIVTRRRRSR